MMCNGALCNGIERITWEAWKPKRGKWWRAVRICHRYDEPLVHFLGSAKYARIRWLPYYERANKYTTKQEAEGALEEVRTRNQSGRGVLRNARWFV